MCFFLPGILTFAQSADLQMTLSCDHDLVTTGSEMTYGLTVFNAGPADAEYLVVVDPLPEGTAFVSTDPECVYVESAHRCDCSLSVLLSEDSYTFDITVEAQEADWTPRVYLSGEQEPTMVPGLFSLDTADDSRHDVTLNDQLVTPWGVARESENALLVADAGDLAIMLGAGLNRDGKLVRIDRATGMQTVVSFGGMLVNPQGVCVASDGRIFVADPDSGEAHGRILEVDPTTGMQIVVAELDQLQAPTGLTIEENGTLLVADRAGRVVRVNPDTGAQTLLSSGGTLDSPEAIALESDTQAVVVDGAVGIIRIALETGAQTVVARLDDFPFVFQQPTDIEVGPEGKLYVADPFSHDIGAILRFDSLGGELEAVFQGGISMGFQNPRGLELAPVIVNTASVTSETPDPDEENDTDLISTELVEPRVISLHVQENVQVVDQIITLVPVVLQVQETVAVTDQLALFLPVVLEVNETVQVQDAVQMLLPIQLNVNETVAVTDQVAVATPIVLQVQESVTVHDGIQAMPALLLQVNETVQVTDQVTVHGPVILDLQESVHVADQVTVTLPVVLNLQETVHVADQCALAPPIVLSVNETVQVVDAVQSLMPIVLMIQESVQVTDAVVVSPDAGPPTVMKVMTLAGARELFQEREIDEHLSQLLIQYSKAVYDPIGHDLADDVTNPQNYMLVAPGADGDFDTLSCLDGVHPDDVSVPTGPVTYFEPLWLAAVRLNAAQVLPAGHYRLFVCGSTSIVDETGVPLDGDEDGEPGDDFVLDFTVLVTNLLENGNFDDDLDGWSWTQISGTEVLLDELDATQPGASGSAFMTTYEQAGVLELSQIVDVTSGAWARLGGTCKMDNPLGLPVALAQVTWYDGGAGSGSSIGEWLVPVATGNTDGQWIRFQDTIRVPDGAMSARVAFVGDDGGRFAINWDELFFHQDSTLILFDDFESGGLEE